MKLKPISLPAKENSETGDIVKVMSDKLSLATIDYSLTKKYHIYLIDEEAEVKEGDWYLAHGFKTSFPQQATKELLEAINVSDQYKIIASTDSSLKIESELSAYYRNGVGRARCLPLLSEQSIKLLIDYYNKNGKMPDEVKVEHEVISFCGHVVYDGVELTSDLKVNISIPEEKMYSREDVINILPNRGQLKKMFTSSHYDNKNGHHDRIDYKHVTGAEKLIDWIKKNL